MVAIGGLDFCFSRKRCHAACVSEQAVAPYVYMYAIVRHRTGWQIVASQLAKPSLVGGGPVGDGVEQGHEALDRDYLQTERWLS